jgi:hypothetical protein
LCFFQSVAGKKTTIVNEDDGLDDLDDILDGRSAGKKPKVLKQGAKQPRKPG